MYKIAVMGAYDSIYGFAALGLDIFSVSDVREGERLLRRLTEGGYAVIYITEALASGLTQALSRYRGASVSGDYSDTGHFRQYRSGYRRREEGRPTGGRLRYFVRRERVNPFNE